MKWPSSAFWPENSAEPQLIDTTETPGMALAVSTAVIMSVKFDDFASTTTILAPGATAWAHSTSSISSPAQPPSADAPAWLTTVRAGPGRPNF